MRSRERVARLIRRTLRLIDEVDPALRVRPPRFPVPAGQLLCVYRLNNWRHVAALVDDCSSLGWPAALHALDAVHPALALCTASVGPGGRFENLNRLLAHTDPARWTVISDDDVVLPHAGLGPLVALCSNIGVDIAQPAHRADSYYNYRFTRRRPGAIARITSFVEIGPMVAFSPAARARVTPFPERGMGWGTELEWHDARRQGLTLGIIDGVPLVHLATPARAYDRSIEADRIKELLAARGLRDFSRLLHTDRTYPFWTINRGYAG